MTWNSILTLRDPYLSPGDAGDVGDPFANHPMTRSPDHPMSSLADHLY
jgi:hypothetical protein